MNIEKKAQTIADKIKGITANKTQVIANYGVHDESVQAELRLRSSWIIRVPVDEINYPRDLSGNNTVLWHGMWQITRDICTAADLKRGNASATISINERTKTGPARRAEAKAAWLIEAGTAFLEDYRVVTGKRSLAAVRKQITALQAQQKALLPALRESNSLYLSGKKAEKAEQTRKNAAALASGRFWEADKDTLKGYFHPPFDKNYLADVSERWRAALFLECESISYRDYFDNWRHKLGGTGRGFLCGIDDNGDEWGHEVVGLPQSSDSHGNNGLDNTVEEAMANLFGIRASRLPECTRQGDILFCPVKIPAADRTICDDCGAPESDHHASVRYLAEQVTENYLACHYEGNCQEYRPRTIKAPMLAPAEKWTPRESHDITSPSLRHNGRYFAADHDITVSHTSHAAVTLPPGEYRLYALEIADAD